MKKDILVKISIIFMAWVSMADNVVTPIIMNILGAYPEMTNFQMNFILSGSMLITAPAAIFFGKLAQYVGKKSILIFGYALYIITGLLPVFSDSIAVLMFCRGAVGISCGTLGACAFSIIAELYQDERVSSTMMGWYNAFGGLAGVIMSTLSGVIALNNWHYSFLLNAFGVICLILIILFLPSVPPEGKSAKEQGLKEKIPARVWWYTISTFVYCALCMPAFYFVAMFVAEEAIGTSATAGVLTSMLTLGSFVVGLGFGIVFSKLRLYTETMFYFVCAVSLILLYFINGAILAGALIFLIGFGYGACLSYYYMVATIYAPPSKAAFATGMINAALSLGCFACTYVVVFFQEFMGLISMSSVFLACGIVMAIFGILATILAVRYTKSDKRTIETQA